MCPICCIQNAGNAHTWLQPTLSDIHDVLLHGPCPAWPMFASHEHGGQCSCMYMLHGHMLCHAHPLSAPSVALKRAPRCTSLRCYAEASVISPTCPNWLVSNSSLCPRLCKLGEVCGVIFDEILHFLAAQRLACEHQGQHRASPQPREELVPRSAPQRE